MPKGTIFLRKIWVPVGVAGRGVETLFGYLGQGEA